ncbi:hypothetical protein MHYP_G00229820 [Metynnis hypsauchen]
MPRPVRPRRVVALTASKMRHVEVFFLAGGAGCGDLNASSGNQPGVFAAPASRLALPEEPQIKRATCSSQKDVSV